MAAGGHSMLTQEQLDMDLMAEAELDRLQRQYRIMEGDRKAFRDETANKLAKQKKEIQLLRRERDDLLDDIKVATCQTQKKRDAKSASQLGKILREYDDVIARVQAEKLRLEEVDVQIKKTEKEVSRLRLKEVTDTEFATRVKSGQKSIQMLENKLNAITKRFCAILTQNKSLREEIDHLLKERTRFNDIWEKLLTDLNNGKKLMIDLIEQATMAYDQREEWCSKLQALKIRAHNDVISHTQEMREMQRQLDHDGNLREFLTIKGQKRIMKDLEEKEQKRREEEKEDMEKQAEIYRQTLEAVKKVCGEEDVAKMTAKYLKQDEENFALFNYVNELSHELEVIGENIEQIEEKIDEQKEISEQRAQSQRETIESLGQELEETTKIADGDQEELRKSEEELGEILGEIRAIFDLLQCETTPILGLLDRGSINEDNVMIYIGLIQKKVSTLVTNTYFKEKSLLTFKKPRSLLTRPD